MIGIPGVDTARVWLSHAGTVRVQTSSPAIGQGSQTTFAQIVASGLGVAVDQVVVEQTDTAAVSRGTGTFMEPKLGWHGDRGTSRRCSPARSNPDGCRRAS